jgi:hypothetical protein
LKVVLGFVGDREQKIKENAPFWKRTESFMEAEGFGFDELLEMVHRIDSNYKVGEREAVMRTPHQLRGCEDGSIILGNSEWKHNLEKLDAKIKEILSEPPEWVDEVQVKHLDTLYAVISQVTRQLAWGTGKDTVVINTGFFEDMDQLYSRSNVVDMQELIEQAKRKGYNAGGKKDVIGAIIPKAESDGFLAEIIEYIKKNR